MLITCPNCQASYTVADTALGEKGRSVRCAKCKEVWHAVPQAPVMAEAAAEEWQPSVDEWKPSVDEWQPSVEQPATENNAAQTGDAAWPQHDTVHGEDPPHVDDAPPVAPAEGADTAQDAAPSGTRSGIDYETTRRRKAARLKAQKERGFGITAGRVAAALGGILVALLIGRESVVRMFPQTASLYARLGFNINVRGLEFADLKTSYDTQDGTRVLFVEGDIRNISSAVQPVDNLRFSLRNAAGVEVYSWNGVPDRNLMPPGETTQFRSRLASPPTDGRGVRVSFMPREAAAPAKH
jgi:predicted Zn finger-like uncharacterized protein